MKRRRLETLDRFTSSLPGDDAPVEDNLAALRVLCASKVPLSTVESLRDEGRER